MESEHGRGEVALDIDTDSLRTVASELGGAATALSETSGNLGSIGSLADGAAQAGLQALTVAWGAALDVLAQDVTFLSGRVGNAATTYDTTDQALAAGNRGR
jgi:hypothetical protein